eukprot:gene21686-28064_t
MSNITVNSVDLSGKCLGFIGCGKISSAVCRGFASLPNNIKPKKIIVSKRSINKSNQLVNDYPDLIVSTDDNQYIINESDIIFIGLLPNIAESILPNAIIPNEKFIVSMMAAVDINKVLQWTRSDPHNTVRTVPLPSASKRTGPILMFPSNDYIESVLSLIGTPVICDKEDEMKTFVSITGHISPFYELMNVIQQWAVANNVSSETSRKFIASFYSSLSIGAELSTDSFQELCEEAATPSGLNEQAINKLRNTNHYNDVIDSLSDILLRLKKK